MKDLTKKDKAKAKMDRTTMEEAAAAVAFLIKTCFIAAMCFVIAVGTLVFILRAGWLLANNLFGGG